VISIAVRKVRARHPNVIFPTANVIKDGTIYIYYGCTDTCISVATVAVSEMLDFALRFPTAK
jgi:predicted GH43/DUF377 family glycosyl hydrolase